MLVQALSELTGVSTLASILTVLVQSFRRSSLTVRL